MDVATIASALVGAQIGQTEIALAANMMRMNARSENSVAQLLDAGAQNLAKAATGLGVNIDINV